MHFTLQRELKAVLDYMYNGEVSVAQDWLNSFLMASEELAVKGLATGNNINTATPEVEDGPQVHIIIILT